MIKKSVFSHIFNRSLARVGGGLVFCIAVNLLFSCNNFLDGSEFKEQLEKDIAYANAPSYEIRIECDEGTGTITTGTILSKKVIRLKATKTAVCLKNFLIFITFIIFLFTDSALSLSLTAMNTIIVMKTKQRWLLRQQLLLRR